MTNRDGLKIESITKKNGLLCYYIINHAIA